MRFQTPQQNQNETNIDCTHQSCWLAPVTPCPYADITWPGKYIMAMAASARAWQSRIRSSKGWYRPQRDGHRQTTQWTSGLYTYLVGRDEVLKHVSEGQLVCGWEIELWCSSWIIFSHWPESKAWFVYEMKCCIFTAPGFPASVHRIVVIQWIIFYY